MNHIKKIAAVLLSAAICCGTAQLPPSPLLGSEMTVSAETIVDLPSSYQSAADWIWTTRIQGEKSVEAWDTIYDKIVAGNGTLHYLVKWHSYETITLVQRQQLENVLETAVNAWTDWLVGYENWPFTHVNVKIIGWAVLDKSSLLDLQDDEVVYTDTAPYDPTWDIQNGMGDSSIPTVVPVEPSDLFRYEHWRDPNWTYNGSYENRFDMFLQATHGMIDMGGYGYYWGQQLSDHAVKGLIDGTASMHILVHEVGHGFGFTDFYGGEGESDGFPPGGFPDGNRSIMMAGSSAVVTDFDGWFARYVWTKISAEAGRFDLSAVTTEPVVTTTTTAETATTTETTTTTVTTTAEPLAVQTATASLTNIITDIVLNENVASSITFGENGTYYFSGTDYYGDDESKNLSNYEVGDRVSIQFTYRTDTLEIMDITYLQLEQNVRKLIGDVDADGDVDIADAVMMQKWLLGNGELTDWVAGDINEDGRIHAVDLSLLKQILIATV